MSSHTLSHKRKNLSSMRTPTLPHTFSLTHRSAHIPLHALTRAHAHSWWLNLTKPLHAHAHAHAQVRDDEPSSLIAYTLSHREYIEFVEKTSNKGGGGPMRSGGHSRQGSLSSNHAEWGSPGTSTPPSNNVNRNSSASSSFVKPTLSGGGGSGGGSGSGGGGGDVGGGGAAAAGSVDRDDPDEFLSGSPPISDGESFKHFKLQWVDRGTKFYCKVREVMVQYNMQELTPHGVHHTFSFEAVVVQTRSS
jgi:hypothetical protein